MANASANGDIQLLYGVLGGGSLSGASGALIQSQLNQIIAAINKNPLKVKVTISNAAGSTRSWNSLLQKQLNALSKNGRLSVQVSNLKIGTKAISDFRRQINSILNTINLEKGTSITISSKGIGDIKSQLDASAAAAKSAAASTAQYNAQLRSLGAQAKTIGASINKINLGGFTSPDLSTRKAELADITRRYQEWQAAIAGVRAQGSGVSSERMAAIIAEGNAIQSTVADLERKSSVLVTETRAQQQSNTAARTATNLLIQMQNALRSWTTSQNGSASAEYARITSLVSQLQNANRAFAAGNMGLNSYRATVSGIRTEFIGASRAIREAGENTRSFGNRMGTLAGKFTSWLSVSQVIMRLYLTLRQMVTAVIDVDTAMTELKKVTDETDASYTRFLDNAVSRAKTLGATVSDVVNATADFARLGKPIDDASALADAAIVYKNVGDGIEDISAASESIISTMQAFGIAAEDAMLIVDKFNEVGNNFAISSQGIGEALMRSASALAAGNNTLDESIALITTANTIVQNPEVVGTTMKTISMYLRAAKTEAEEAGESTEGMATSVSALRSEILALTGNRVDIQIDENTFKSTYQIIKELSEVWDSLTDITQANLLEMIGGKRNSNVVSALIENFDIAENVVHDAANAAGSAMEENDKYLESINGHIAQFKATFQELGTTLIGSDFIKSVVDLGTGILNVLNVLGDLIEALGGLNTVLPVTIGLIAAMKLPNILTTLVNIRTAIRNAFFGNTLVKGVQAIQAGLTAATTGSRAAASAFTLLGGSVSVAAAGLSALVAVLGIAAIAYQRHNQKIQEQRDAANEAAAAIQENGDSIEEYKNQIDELRGAIDSGNLSEEEAYNKRQELLEIEQSLVDMFGEEARGIDLVTGSIEGQIAAIDKLSAADWNSFQRENAEAIQRAMDLFTDFSPQDLDWLNSPLDGSFEIFVPNHDELTSAIEDLNLSITPVEFRRKLAEEIEKADIGIELPVSGITGDFASQMDVDSIYEALDAYNQLYDLTDRLGRETFGENYLDYMGSTLSDYSEQIKQIEDAISENEEIFNTYVEGLLNYDETYSDVWGRVLAAQKSYQNAVAQGDDNAAIAAIAQMQAAQDAFLAAGWDNDAVRLYMEDFFEKFEDESRGHELEIELKAKISDESDSLGRSIREAVRAFEDENGNVDLYSILNLGTDLEESGKLNSRRAQLTAQEQAYSTLKYAADEYEVSVEELYYALQDLGVIQNEATDAMRAAHQSYESLAESADAAATVQSAMGSVVADNTYITEDAYNAIVALAGGSASLAECIDTTNGYLVTNADALRNVIDSSQEALLANVRMAESHERLNYHDLVMELDDVVSGMTDYDEASMAAVETIMDQLDAVDRQIARFKLLEQQVLGVANAFAQMEEAQSADEAVDYTDDLAGMVQSLIDAYEAHEFGTQEFRTAFEALIPEDVYEKFEDAGDQLDAGWSYLHGKIRSYFTYDEGDVSVDFDNIRKFVEDGLKTAFGDSTVFTGTMDSFSLNPQIRSVDQLADAMGITTEAAFALGNAISKYTADHDDFLSDLVPDTLETKIYSADQDLAGLLEKRAELGRAGKIDTSEWDELQEKIQAARTDLSKLRDTARQNITAHISLDSDITEKQQEVDELYARLSELDDGSVEYSAVFTNYEEAEQELASLLEKKYQLEEDLGEPTELTISVALEDVQEEIDSVKSQLDSLAEFDVEANAYIAVDDSDQTKVDSLAEQLRALKDEYSQIQLYAGLDDEDVLSSLETIENFTIEDKEFKVGVDGYSTTMARLRTIQRALDRIGTETTANVAVSYRSEGSGGSGNSLIVSGSSSGSGAYAGTAHESGTWGTGSYEKNALVGELGTELYVDPRTGTYQTVGENGAELIDLPKGAIIFNHRQTEALLKNKRINSRGKAYVSGNAHYTFMSGSYDFGTPHRVPGGNTGESGLEDALDKMAEAFEELIGDFEHSIFLLQENGGSTEQIVAVYQQMQNAVREQIEKYRKMGLSDNSDYIQDLEKQWYEYRDAIREAIVSGYEDEINARENAIAQSETLMEHAISNRDMDDVVRYARDIMLEYRAIQDHIREESEYYRSLGYAETSDEISDLKDLWWEYADSILEVKERIVEASSDAVDEIQSVYDTLHSAADEYASGGYVTIDTLQEIISMGAEYMQMLMDENGQLVISEERINAVIAARTQQLAVENAMNYVERLRLALQQNSIEDLNTLLYATTEATDATWGLVYASLALLDLDDNQYQAALHNINALRSMAENAIQGVGSMSDGVLEELQDMQTGLNDILKYVMDMLKQRINDQIEDLEDMKDSYREIIDLRKEALDAAKEESDYQDEVADRIQEIAELQERINALSLDDSREAQSEKAKLEEQMAELQGELADQQADYALNAQKESLDNMATAYEEEKDHEIAVLQDSISSYQKLYDMAISYIRNNWDTLYRELIGWNTQYGTVLNAEITEAWDNCLAAAQRYGSYVSALTQIGGDIESTQSGGGNRVVGNTNYDTTASAEENIHAIVKQMYENSQLHHTATRAEKDRLHAENVRLAAMLGQYGIKAVFANGNWYIDRVGGELIYHRYKKYTYHGGGIVGDAPTLKQNEVMTVLEKREAVLDQDRQNELFRLIDFTTALSDKLGGLLRSDGYQRMMNDARNVLPTESDLSPVQEGQRVNIQFGDVNIYGGNDETVEKHREVNRQFTNEVLRQLNIRR